ncbi:MAG: membrane protein insertion efficiency factor YidD [Candidatus Omnitrophica bacterium]|nr:membrane protein insertion efficiency factor YidD [Candidatus Omnitrophota bacterium]
MKTLIIFILRFYHNYLSLLKLRCCRFYPSCSEYAIESIEKYGLFFGILKSLKRILRCHPLSRGGYDPV